MTLGPRYLTARFLSPASCRALLACLLAGCSAGAFAQDPAATNPLRTPPEQTAPANQPEATGNTAPGNPATDEAAGEDDAAGQTQPATQPAGVEPLTKPQIEELLKRVGDLNLTDNVSANAKKYYQDAIQATTEYEQNLQRVQQYSATHKQQPDEADTDPGAPERYTKEWYQKRLNMPIEKALKLQDIDLANSEEEFLEERATVREKYLNDWNKIAQDLEAAPAIRKQWLSELPARKQAVEQQLAEATEDLKEIDQKGVSNEETAARRVLLIQTVAKLNTELEAMKARREMYQRQEAVHDLELELAKRKAARYKEALAAVRNELSNRRKQAATEQARLAQREAERNKQLISRNASTIGKISDYNLALTEELRDIATAIDQAQSESDRDALLNTALEAKLEDFKAKFGDNKQLTQISGQLLREQRTKLPRLSRIRSKLTRYQQERNDNNFLRFGANQKLEELKDIDAAVSRVLKDVAPEDQSEAEVVVRNLLESQVGYLKNYVSQLDKLDEGLGALISRKTQLETNTREFRDFIAKRDLWIRSCRPLWASEIQPGRGVASWRPFYLAPALEALAWSLNPANWLQVGLDLKQSATRQPAALACLVLVFGVLYFAQHRARSLIKRLGKEAAKKTCTEFLPSLRTVWLTAIVSLPWPFLLWSVGWLLDGVWVEAEFTRALSLAARSSAWIFLFAEFIRQCCRADGLAEAHLGWQRAILLQMRSFLRWIPVLVVPLTFWLMGLDSQNVQPLWSASLGRVLFIVVMVLLTFMLWRLLMSHSSAIYQTLARGSENWLLRAHRVWRPLLVLRPVALAVLAMVGYYYTAEQLTLRVLATEAMLLGLMIAGGLLRRWVLLNRRELAREQAKQRRAQAVAAAQAAASHAEADGDTPPPPPAEMADINIDDSVDLTALSDQTQKLLHMLLLVCGIFGLIFVWQDVFPALGWLDDNPLPWVSDDNDRPTTWGHLLRCLLALTVTYFAVRDLPGLLELVVLQHLPLDQGVRYAVSTLARYLLLALGIVVAAGSLGITGTSISWLVAAMGVGLGFGLQEIFANFVSGIILLFERPIRVGDIITLGDKTGVVNRIRMRATTIVDWDRKEYVVPNKDLVTERLLNWTLSDQTNRIVIEVGVAYGSDTEKACGLLREVVTEHPVVLEDPPALITFEGFGDSTLNLTLRCYLPNLENRLQTIHELHTNINNKFNAAGIEIAFPQRDLHIRSMPSELSSLAKTGEANANGSPELEG